MPTVLSKNLCFLAKALLIILYFRESYTVVSKTAAAKFYDNIQNDSYMTRLIITLPGNEAQF